MSQKTIKVFADLQKEYLYGKALGSGLSITAADYFKYCNEVELSLTVDLETGEVLKAEVTGDYA